MFLPCSKSFRTTAGSTTKASSASTSFDGTPPPSTECSNRTREACSTPTSNQRSVPGSSKPWNIRERLLLRSRTWMPVEPDTSSVFRTRSSRESPMRCTTPKTTNRSWWFRWILRKDSSTRC
uniref:(northern house mosquito) hypothetical protein n=1 Tax=Culex pipiens TaxID=7175 RepID=A0A8D8CMP5_CULPI